MNEAAFQALSQCPKPTIAMIHGFCLGGGLGLALCCDMRLADDASQFAIPAAKLGIGYNARWVRPILAAVPPARAKEIAVHRAALQGRGGARHGPRLASVSGARARSGNGEARDEIAANAPLSVMAAKRTIDEMVRQPEDPDMDALDTWVAHCFASEDYAEGRRAFLEKRKPEFKGK